MSDLTIDCLRIRGPSGRRLASVAARTLPGAVERALYGIDDVALDRVAVVLDFDPDDYDDDTLASIWADRIRAAVIRETANSPIRTHETQTAPGLSLAGSNSGPRDPARSELESIVLGWVRSGTDPTRYASVLEHLSQRAGVDEVTGRWPVAWTDRLVEALEAALASLAESLKVGTESGHRLRAERISSGREGASAPERDPQLVPPNTKKPLGRTDADPDARTDVVARLVRQLCEELSAESPKVPNATASSAVHNSTTHFTEVGGLVLLYPWLGDLCQRWVEQVRDEDPTDVRRSVLAGVADPDRPELVDDALVALLAGTDPGAADSSPVLGLDRRELSEDADRVLAAFAGALPGFAGSTSGFVRDSWITRSGQITSVPDLFAVRLGGRPLDLVLGQLPYPIDFVQLRWSAAMTVRIAS